MNDQDRRDLEDMLARMKQDHRDLDAAIAALIASGAADPLNLQRLKRRKLSLKDRISQIENKLLPDIIA